MPIFATDYIAYSEALTETDYPPTNLTNESINEINSVSDSNSETIVLGGNRNFALKFPTSDLGIPSVAKIVGLTVRLTFSATVSQPLEFYINSNDRDLSNSNPFLGVNIPPVTSHPSNDNTYAEVETGYEVGNYTLLNNTQSTPYMTLIQNDELAIRFVQAYVGFMVFDKGYGGVGDFNITPALKIHYEYGTKTTISGNTKVKLQNQNKIKLI